MLPGIKQNGTRCYCSRLPYAAILLIIPRYSPY